ncbi:MAG: GH32 C-terminal domain-containing protein, partial [Chitinophagaceae bacterium]|nr:GH32 C-terminal domain-containing protein [Chitinophagaceae bacterium]
EELVIGYDKNNNAYFINRKRSGKIDFQNDFAAKHFAPRIAGGNGMNMSIILDESSVELFADDGLSVMTEIFFPGHPYNHIQIKTTRPVPFKKLEYAILKRIWP